MSYQDIDRMAHDYAIDDPVAILTLRHFMESLIEHSVNVYNY